MGKTDKGNAAETAAENAVLTENIADAKEILAQAKAEAQRMIEQAQQEVDQILEQARKTADDLRDGAPHGAGAPSEAEKKEIAEREAYLNEKVPFRLFKDGDKYKDDVLACINGERLLIKRGVDVTIPRKFAILLEQSAAQDAATAAMIEEKESQFDRESKALGI